MSDPTQKRVEGLLGRVIVELSELTGFRRAELESLKAFISRSATTALPGWPTAAILKPRYGAASW